MLRMGEPRQQIKALSMSYNQTESLNKDNQQDRYSLCLGRAVGRALERRRKCNCSNSFFSRCKFAALDERKRNHLDVLHNIIICAAFIFTYDVIMDQSQSSFSKQVAQILTQLSRLKLRTRSFHAMKFVWVRIWVDSVSWVDSTEWRFEWRSYNRPLVKFNQKPVYAQKGNQFVAFQCLTLHVLRRTTFRLGIIEKCLILRVFQLNANSTLIDKRGRLTKKEHCNVSNHWTSE